MHRSLQHVLGEVRVCKSTCWVACDGTENVRADAVAAVLTLFHAHHFHGLSRVVAFVNYAIDRREFLVTKRLQRLRNICVVLDDAVGHVVVGLDVFNVD